MKLKTFAPLLVLTAVLCLGNKGADLKPSMTSPGKLVFQDDFSNGSLAKPWTVAKGDWQEHDGMVAGKEKKEDKHNAVLSLNEPNRNSVIQVSFKLDGAKFFHLSYNHAKGHLFRVIVDSAGVSISKDKDLQNPAAMSGVLAKSDKKFEAGKWYTMMVEVQGAKVTVQTDNGVKLSATEASLDRDKINYRFVTSGETLDIAGVKVWKVE